MLDCCCTLLFLAPTFLSSFLSLLSFSCFFFTDTATTEIYTLSLHDALPIFHAAIHLPLRLRLTRTAAVKIPPLPRSEEHTSELQSLRHLVCRLLLEKKKKTNPMQSAISNRDNLARERARQALRETS